MKAHKCTALAAEQLAVGHRSFTCATPREVVGMAEAGLGDDLLLANEVRRPATARRDGCAADARVTVAVDSTRRSTPRPPAGIREVLIDVNVGLPRCGCDPDDAGRLADLARATGLEVRGVMGYEGHLMIVDDRADRTAQVEECMAKLLQAAHDDVGGDIVSAGGTGTYDLHRWVTEIQAGSYALMDTVLRASSACPSARRCRCGTVISVSAEVGGRRRGPQGARHGPRQPVDRRRDGLVLLRRARHVRAGASSSLRSLRVGDRVKVLPAHVDPTMALHERVHSCDGDDVVDTWPIDLRGW